MPADYLKAVGDAPKLKEKPEPKHDVVIVRKLANVLRVSKGGIAMPGVAGAMNVRGSDDRYEVEAVGPGTWSNVADIGLEGSFLRKPMCVKKGDIVGAINGIAFPFNCDGEVLYIIHDYQVTIVIRTGADGEEYAEPQHDYVLFKPNREEQVSRGGIHMPDVEDPTGNERSSGRYDVVSVGPGPWVIAGGIEDDNPSHYARRPMCVGLGDVFLFEGKGFLIHIPGDEVGVIQDYQVATIFRRAAPPLIHVA